MFLYKKSRVLSPNSGFLCIETLENFVDVRRDRITLLAGLRPGEFRAGLRAEKSHQEGMKDEFPEGDAMVHQCPFPLNPEVQSMCAQKLVGYLTSGFSPDSWKLPESLEEGLLPVLGQ